MATGPLALDQLIDQAQQATGLDDFGDQSWKEGAERLISDLNERGALTEVGSMIAASDVVEYLAGRLRVVDWVKRNPSIADADIRPPIVVLGQPRTGTTILFDVLAQDPANRVPLTWEVDQPWPPPETATYDSDPRIDEVDAKLANVDLLIPGFRAMHDMGARLGQECVRITAGDFRSMIFSTQYRVPEYQRWLLHQADMALRLSVSPNVPAVLAVGAFRRSMGDQVASPSVVAQRHVPRVSRGADRSDPSRSTPGRLLAGIARRSTSSSGQR